MNPIFRNWIPVLALLSSVGAIASETESPLNCHRDLCVGDRAVNVLRDYREVTVVGIDAYGKFVVRFEDNGGVGGNWDREDLAVMYGCSGDLCVGYPAINVTRDYRRVTIHALHSNGKYVLRFDDNRGVGGNWDRWDVAVPWGCVNDLCVNDTVYNRSNGRQATIAAIQTSTSGRADRMVLSYPTGLGGNWEYTDLVLLSRGTVAYPPTRPYCPPGTSYDPRTGRCETDYPPPPPPSRWSCTFYRNGRTLNGSGYTRGAAISSALRACAAVRATPPCRAPEAVCRQY